MSSSIIVDVVKSKKDLKEFINFPWKIYKNDPNWVPPLKDEVKKMLDTKKNPFWEHARRELFIARRDKDVVGRIAAIIDPFHNERHNDKVGFFGFFECINDKSVSSALFDKAAEWLKQQGCDRMRGPLSPSMNDEIGFLLEGFNSPPVLMMSYTPPYYLDLAKDWGLVKVKDLYAFFKDATKGINERVERLIEKIKERTHVEIRSFDMKNFKRDVGIIKDLYNRAWEKNWGAVPMTEKEMDALAENLKTMCEPELIKFAFINGEPVGLSVVLPNINEIIKDFNGNMNIFNMIRFLINKKKIKGVRALIFGFIEGYRQTGLPLVLYYETEKSGRKLGYEWVELSWNLEDNDLINKFDEMVGAHIYKKYRICEKPI